MSMGTLSDPIILREVLPPSTACRQSAALASGGVALGRGPPGYERSPGGLRGRQIPPPPPPPPPGPVPHAPAVSSAARYPREWTPLNTKPNATGGGGPPNGPPNGPGGSSDPGANGHSGQGNNPHPGGGATGSNGSGGGAPPPPGGQPGGSTPPGNIPPQQTGGAGLPGGAPQAPPGISQPIRQPDPWDALDRSRKPLPKLLLPSNYKVCSILDMRQILESWYDKSTFAIATWRGDAQRYWLTKVLDCARNRHDQWLQSTPSQRASLEPLRRDAEASSLLCKECTLLVRVQLSNKNANHPNCAFADSMSTTMCGAMISLTPCIAPLIERECDLHESAEFQDAADMIQQLNSMLAKPIGFPQIPIPRKDCHIFYAKPDERHKQYVISPEQDCEWLVYMSDQNTSMVEAIGVHDHALWARRTVKLTTNGDQWSHIQMSMVQIQLHSIHLKHRSLNVQQQR